MRPGQYGRALAISVDTYLPLDWTSVIEHQERSFGVSVGGVCCAIALWMIYRGRLGRAEVFGAIGAGLVVAGLVAPTVLRAPARAWFRFARALAWVNTRVLLTIAFALIVVPLGFMWRLTGSDPLAKRRRAFGGWTPYPARYHDKDHYLRMY